MSRLRIALVLLVFALPSAASASSPDVVVSQVYGGGGNSGAPFTNDFIELFNRGTAAVDVTGWTVQYATASSATWSRTTLSGTIAPGGYYLVQEGSGGTTGSALPVADAAGTINLSSSSAKVAVVRGGTALTCGASPGSCASDTSIADLVGYGSASDYEGSSAPGLSSTTAAVRADAGCTDTDDNGSDFSSSAPDPRNSASPHNDCGGPPPPPPPPPPGSTASGGATVTADVASTLTISLSRSTLDFGRLAYGSTPPSIDEDVTVASNDAAGYILSVHRTAFTPDDLPLALSATAPVGGLLNASLAGGAKAAIPISPASDLQIGSTAGLSGSAGDVWATVVGFLEPLPVTQAGPHSATLTYTVVGR